MVKHELTNSTNKSAMKWLYLVQHRSRSNKLIFDLVLQSTYLAHSAHWNQNSIFKLNIEMFQR